MLLTDASKLFVRKVSSISGVDEKTIKNIYHYTLLMACLDLYSGSDSVSIPYFFDLKISQDPETKNPKYSMSVSSIFNNMVIDIMSGNKVEFEKYIRKAIQNQVENILL